MLFTGGGGGGPKTNHTCLKTTYKTRNLHGCFDFFLFRSSYKIFQKKELGVQRTPPPVKKGLITKLLNSFTVAFLDLHLDYLSKHNIHIILKYTEN